MSVFADGQLSHLGTHLSPERRRDLVSIIVLCCNELPFTQLCFDSLNHHTVVPHELIVVDNGSTDQTPAFLQAFARQAAPGREQLVLIRNESNRGFAPAVNQALRHCQGSYVLLLNNDVVVTPHWLEDLVACARSGVGLVGPTSNYVPPPQLVEPGYQKLTDLDAFAATHRQQFRGKALPVERLSGFCLLIRHEVLDRIGALDERFGTGFFEDDDLCFRAKDAGFSLAVVLDVYLHHFGSRTFAGQNISAETLLQTNFQIFQEKWGKERTQGYHLPVRSPVNEAPQHTSHTKSNAQQESDSPVRVSLCMIVKNEEANLTDCLKSVEGLVQEIVVVDTGSTDRTKEIATSFGVKVVDFPWVDSFAAARNVSLDHATGDYCLWLDADDRLTEANRQKLKELFASLQRGPPIGYSLKCECLPDPITKATTVVDHIRLFSRHPNIRWRYRVHEQILPALRQLGGAVQWSDVVIHHVGYQDPALRQRKLQRDLRLLHLEDQEHPDDPFTLFNLGSVYLELSEPQKALPCLQRSLARSHVSDSIVRKLYGLIAASQKTLGQFQDALLTCIEGRRHYPQDAELLYREALLRREAQDLPGAAACLEKLLTEKEAEHFASIDPAWRGNKARFVLSLVYREQGRFEKAETLLLNAISEQGETLHSLMELGAVYLDGLRFDKVEEIASRCDLLAPSDLIGTTLRVRSFLAQKRFDETRSTLLPLIEQNADRLDLRVLLSHSYLQEGKDWKAAEQALRDILERAPDHPEARQNLAVLLRQQGGEVSQGEASSE
jgi:GT2 family glycosyltransferase/tetratricopeptide (TPR) repeat protein